MQRIVLGENWQMEFMEHELEGISIPASVYSVLLERGLMEDPYYRDNELKALELMENDCRFKVNFKFNLHEAKTDEHYKRAELVLEGVDTLATVWLNNCIVGMLNNMHRTWRFDVTEILHDGDNSLEIKIESPTRFIREENEKVYCGGSGDAMSGFPHLRKAHCMFGWDWGPRLPDMGIFRAVYINLEEEAVLEGEYITQSHERKADGSTDVTLSFAPEIRFNEEAEVQVIHVIKLDDERTITTDSDEIVIENAKLWWPNGYGEQNLYTVRTLLLRDGQELLDVIDRRIGLRTLTVNHDKDEWGECFAHEINGVKIFAMGADYIPEDNILARVTGDRTRKLLEDAVAAHHNSIRVWGGGYYPGHEFYDACDELGLIVWQDCMFACASYELDDEFDENIRAEIRDNVRRLRHHASLGLWCGNNEMETQTLDGAWRPSIKQKADYLKIFDYIIPSIIKEEDPQAFYWPSSPSSGGNFDNPWDENRGDTHYWDVWHGCKPFTEFRKFRFRYLSEFGFQSFPNMRTIESFTLPEDRNVFSRIIEMHQRNAAANGKIVNYLSATYLYPYSFERFVYLSQMLQAEAIRYGVEHFRRNRGRCMGAVVWQLNDIWPVASWSSIDYFGRWKALHYAEKKMFNPILISCEEHGEIDQRPNCVAQPAPFKRSIRLNVSNETFTPISGEVVWELRKNTGEVVLNNSTYIEVGALASYWLDETDFGELDTLSHYVSYRFIPSGRAEEAPAFEHCDPEALFGTVLFAAPKHFKFIKPSVSVSRNGDILTITSDTYVKNLEISSTDICSEGELRLSDNYFDMNPGVTQVKILEGNPKSVNLVCINDDEVRTINL